MTFVVLDIETTGLNIRKDRIIELGALKVKDGKIIDTVYIARRKLSGLRSYSLAALRQFFNIIPTQVHRALSDVEDTLQIYFELIKR
ncbi:MAG: hypothetical protein K9L74_01655 [Candidatus Izimaplasma sp.]|nr:hypothetical protein [Candidatus Izimaplasma bacterium]